MIFDLNNKLLLVRYTNPEKIFTKSKLDFPLAICTNTDSFPSQGITPPSVCGSEMSISDANFPSRIPDPESKRHRIPDPQHKISVFLTQKIVTKLTEIRSVMFIPDPYFFPSRIRGSRKHWNSDPDPDPQYWPPDTFFLLIRVYLTKMFLLLRRRLETWPGQAWWWWFWGDWAAAWQDFSPSKKCGSRSLSSARGPTLNRNKNRN